MLRISRKTGQSIRIGDNIVVTIQEIRGRQVRLMVQAPEDVKIYREELHQELIEENTRAASVAPDALERLK